MSEGAAARTSGRPPQLSRARIVRAAAESENLDALTMRELAGRLGVSHPALYRWVRCRDDLFELVAQELVDRVLASLPARSAGWRARLTQIGWAMHDAFLSVPGYATHLARPHPHDAHATARLRTAVMDALGRAHLTDDEAEQSWHIFITAVVSWLAFEEQGLELGSARPTFGTFIDVLTRGLPARPDPAAAG